MSEKTTALKYAWWVEDEKLALVYADLTNSEDSYSSPSIVKEVTVGGVFLPDNFVSATTSSTANEAGMEEACTLPEEFHEAIVQKAIEKGYETKPEQIQLAMYYGNKFEMCVKQAKQKANTRGIVGASIRLVDF